MGLWSTALGNRIRRQDLFPSSTESDAEKYPISLKFKLYLSESVAVSFVIQHCDAFSKKNTQRSKFSKLLSIRSSR